MTKLEEWWEKYPGAPAPHPTQSHWQTAKDAWNAAIEAAMGVWLNTGDDSVYSELKNLKEPT